MTAGLNDGDSLDSGGEKDPPSFEDLISLQSDKPEPDSDEEERPEVEEAKTITSGKASIV